MKNCRIKLSSTVDGKKTETAYEGQIEVLDNLITVSYAEEQAFVELRLMDKKVSMQRTGDYTLKLAFEKGKVCNGLLGIAGSEGALQTETTRLAYLVTDDSFMLTLHYKLLIGTETQDMRLRLDAKIG